MRPRRPRLTRCSAVAIGAMLAAVAVAASPAVASPSAAAHVRFSRPASPKSGPANLIDHGGKILTSPTLYAIWWGDPSKFPSDAATGLTSLLQGFGKSNYLQLGAQYMRGASLTASYGRSFTDTSTPPSHQPSVGTIVGEVQKVLGTTVPDPQAVYFVFTSNYPKSNYCAWHSAGTVNGVTIQAAYLPNTDGIAGCDPGDLYHANGFSEGTRSIADSTAHEFMESVTDAVPTSGWADKNGEEVADKCNFTYANAVQVGTYSWQLQEEWSNAISGCVQGT